MVAKEPARFTATRASKPSGLPDFDAPPVNEVACGVGFTPLTSLRVAHIGRFWDAVRDRYPRVEDAPPLAEEGELFLSPTTGLPPSRVWFINEADSRLIQFQQNKLFVNWRSREGEPQYPRYPEILSDFRWAYESLQTFTKANGLEQVNVETCDLTYINHLLPSGNVTEFLSTTFRDMQWANEARFLPSPINVSWRLRFVLPDERGHLSVRIYQATRNSDGAPLLVFELSAKGRPRSTNTEAIVDWFDLAREWIVKGFEDLTKSEAQLSLWKRKS